MVKMIREEAKGRDGELTPLGALQHQGITRRMMDGRPAVTRAADLDPELLRALRPDEDGVLDEPPAPGGGEASTIVAPEGGRRLRVIRKGALPLSALEQAGFSLLSSSLTEVRA